MSADRPTTVVEYRHWLRENLDVDESRARAEYEFASARIREVVASHRYWTDLPGLTGEWAAEYEVTTGYPLFAASEQGKPAVPGLALKPYSSLLEKTMRLNVSRNPNWPEEPPGGWVTASNWYERVGDIVRTTFVVKYLDGVIELKDRLRGHAEQCGLSARTELAARHEGHYAAHVDVGFELELPTRSLSTRRVTAGVELQVTTQLQDVIATMMHRQYESARSQLVPIPWEWDFRSEGFHVNYLGHVLHYLEGMIMEQRERETDDRP